MLLEWLDLRNKYEGDAEVEETGLMFSLTGPDDIVFFVGLYPGTGDALTVWEAASSDEVRITYIYNAGYRVDLYPLARYKSAEKALEVTLETLVAKYKIEIKEADDD